MRDPFFRRFFGGPGQSEPQIAAGSGVIVDAKNGYVMTNAHVVKDAREVLVTLKDNRRLPAKLVGADPGTDIAVVRVDPKNLVDVRFGDSDALQVGDFVIAIGNPFGLGQTATSGIVSALGRSGLSMEGYEHFIQTDASINPGNSGGALVNLRGELVGINTAIIGPAGGNVGIGFAVPVVMARAVMEQLVKFGEVKRGRLGISMTDVVGGEGATVADVQADSPAAKAGLRKADVVTGLNGRPVRGAAELRARLGVVPVGDTVELQVQRGAEKRTIKAQIAAIESGGSGGEAVQELSGAVFQEVAKSGLPGRNRAVLVTAVKPESPAYRHGLRAGDLIIGVNAQRVASIKELTGALKRRGGVQLNVLRGDNMLTIPVS
jgi:serine protease Do/serine protease DegQ